MSSTLKIKISTLNENADSGKKRISVLGDFSTPRCLIDPLANGGEMVGDDSGAFSHFFQEKYDFLKGFFQEKYAYLSGEKGKIYRSWKNLIIILLQLSIRNAYRNFTWILMPIRTLKDTHLSFCKRP